MAKFIMHMGGLMAFNLEGKIKDTVQVLLVSPERVKHRQTLIVRVRDVVIPDEKTELNLPGRSMMGPEGQACLAFDLSGTIMTLARGRSVTEPRNRGRRGQRPDRGRENDFHWVPSMQEIDRRAVLNVRLTTKPVVMEQRKVEAWLGARIDLVGAGGSLRADERCYEVDPSIWKFTKANNDTFTQYVADATKLRIRKRRREQIVLTFEFFDGKPAGALVFKPGKTRRCTVTCFPVEERAIKRAAVRDAPHFDNYFYLCDPPLTPTACPEQDSAMTLASGTVRFMYVYPTKCMPTEFP